MMRDSKLSHRKPPMLPPRGPAAMVTPGRPAGFGAGGPSRGMLAGSAPAAMPTQSAPPPGMLAGIAAGAPMLAGIAAGAPAAGPMTQQASRAALGMKKGGAVKGYAKGGMASRGDGCCMKGKTKGTMK